MKNVTRLRIALYHALTKYKYSIPIHNIIAGMEVERNMYIQNMFIRQTYTVKVNANRFLSIKNISVPICENANIIPTHSLQVALLYVLIAPCVLYGPYYNIIRNKHYTCI